MNLLKLKKKQISPSSQYDMKNENKKLKDNLTCDCLSLFNIAAGEDDSSTTLSQVQSRLLPDTWT